MGGGGGGGVRGEKGKEGGEGGGKERREDEERRKEKRRILHFSCAPLTPEVGDGPSSFLRSDSSSFHMEVICSCACTCGGCRWGGGGG